VIVSPAANLLPLYAAPGLPFHICFVRDKVITLEVLGRGGLRASAIRARAEDMVAGRNPGDESVDPNFSRSSGRTPS